MHHVKTYIASMCAGTAIAAAAVVGALLTVTILGFDGWSGGATARGAQPATLAPAPAVAAVSGGRRAAPASRAVRRGRRSAPRQRRAGARPPAPRPPQARPTPVSRAPRPVTARPPVAPHAPARPAAAAPPPPAPGGLDVTGVAGRAMDRAATSASEVARPIGPPAAGAVQQLTQTAAGAVAAVPVPPAVPAPAPVPAPPALPGG
jgi:hypothetical protein